MNPTSPLSRSTCPELAHPQPLAPFIGRRSAQFSALSLSDVLVPPRAYNHVCHAASAGAGALVLAEPRVGPYPPKDKAGLAKEVGRWSVHCRLANFFKLQELDVRGEAFWGEFRQLNERLLSTVLPKCLTSDGVYLKDIDLERLKRQELKPELVSQFVYWLLVSPHGPECLVSTPFDTAEKIIDWLSHLNVVGAALFVKNSRSVFRARARVSQGVHKARPPVFVRRVGYASIEVGQEQAFAMERRTTLKPISH